MPRRIVLVAAGWMLYGACTTAWAQGTFFLKTEQVKDAGNDSVASSASSYLMKLEEKPEVKLPSGLGRTYFYRGNVAGRNVLMMIDVNKSTRRLFVDTNGDDNLADEQPIKSKRTRSGGLFGISRSYMFGPVSLKPRDADKKDAKEKTVKAADVQPISAKPQAAEKPTKSLEPGKEKESASEDAKKATSQPAVAIEPGSFWVAMYDLEYLLTYPATYQKGKIRLGEKTLTVALLDGDFNGQFNDLMKFPVKRDEGQSCDMLSIDFDGDGEFSQSYSTTIGEVRPLTKLINYKDTFYTVQVTADGSSITIDKTTPKMGTLDLGTQSVSLQLMSDNGVFDLTTTNEPLSLPAGQYGAYGVTLKQREGEIKWSLSAREPKGKITDFTITEGQATKIELGPPLTLKITERNFRPTRSTRAVSFNVSCTDKSGIEYNVGVEKNGRRMAAPSVKIYDEKDKVLSSGQFEYG